METTENAKERAEIRNKMRERTLKSNIRKFIDRMKQIEQTKKEDTRKRIEKNKEKMDKMRQVRDMAAKLERRKMVKTVTEWKRKESERKKMRKIRLNREEQERKQFLQDRWQKKQQLQIKELKKEGFLKHCIEQERQMFIQEYKEKIEKERLRMKNLLEKSKKFVKCCAARYVSANIRRTCYNIPKLCAEENHERTNAGDKKRGKKLKASVKEMKKNKWKKKPKNKKTILTPENNESVESKEFETISCTEIISEDDLKSKCECEKVKFHKRYEIPELLIK